MSDRKDLTGLELNEINFHESKLVEFTSSVSGCDWVLIGCPTCSGFEVGSLRLIGVRDMTSFYSYWEKARDMDWAYYTAIGQLRVELVDHGMYRLTIRWVSTNEVTVIECEGVALHLGDQVKNYTQSDYSVSHSH